PLSGLFSPAAFYRPLLGVLSASAGSLTVLGVVLLVAASVLWRRGLPRRWWSTAAAGLLVLAAPYLVRYLGRGIAPPAGGVGIATVAGTAAALVTWGAAVEGRLELATRDAARLGRTGDPPVVALLERLGREPPAIPPRTAGELYAWWCTSPLAADQYPASLALWPPPGA